MEIHWRAHRPVCAVLVFAAGSNDLVPKAFGYLFIFPSARPPARPPCHLTVTLLYNGPDLVLLLLLDSFAHTHSGTDECVLCECREQSQFSGQHVLRLPVMCRPSKRDREREPKSRPQHLHAVSSDLFHTHASGPDD